METGLCQPSPCELTRYAAAAHGQVDSLPPEAVAALQRLRQLGHRSTGACRHVLNELATTARHLTADELFSTLPVGLANCERSTIHRQLSQLQHAGIIHSVPSSRATTYGLIHTSPHQHESCLRCGRTIDKTSSPEGADWPPASGFLTAVSTTVTLGTCATCPGKDTPA